TQVEAWELLQWGRAGYSTEMQGADREGWCAVTLQWGRAGYSTEMSGVLCSAGMRSRLQWGRAGYSTEMSRHGPARRARRTASMGPCWVQHGNVPGRRERGVDR